MINQKTVELVAGAVLMALSAALFFYMRTRPWYTPQLSVIDDSSFFPTVVTVCIGVFGFVQIVYATHLAASDETVSINLRGLVLIAIWAGYCFVLTSLGFLVSSVAALFLSQVLWGERRMAVAIPVSVLLPLGVYVILGKILHASFPQGIIPF